MKVGLTRKIEPHIPCIRRYARLHTGQRDVADHLIVSALRSLIDTPEKFPDTADGRVAVYKWFVDDSGLGKPEEPFPTKLGLEAPSSEKPVNAYGFSEARSHLRVADNLLQSLAPCNRAAFILSSVDEFTPDEAAEILSMHLADIKEFIRDAVEDISRRLKANVLLLHEQSTPETELKRIIEILGHDAVEAQPEALPEKKPELIFVDFDFYNSPSFKSAHLAKALGAPLVLYPGKSGQLRPVPGTLIVEKPFAPYSIRAAITEALIVDPGRTH